MEPVYRRSVKLGFIRNSRWLFFLPEQIVRLEAQSNYTLVHFTEHPPILMAKVLRLYEDLLRPYGFIRVHKSHLVNSLYITSVDRNGLVMMTDESTAEVSRRRRKEVMERVGSTEFSANKYT